MACRAILYALHMTLPTCKRSRVSNLTIYLIQVIILLRIGILSISLRYRFEVQSCQRLRCVCKSENTSWLYRSNLILMFARLMAYFDVSGFEITFYKRYIIQTNICSNVSRVTIYNVGNSENAINFVCY